MCEYSACMQVCSMYLPAICGRKKRLLDPLELELGVVVSHQLSAENQTQDLCKNNQFLTTELSLQCPQTGSEPTLWHQPTKCQGHRPERTICYSLGQVGQTCAWLLLWGQLRSTESIQSGSLSNRAEGRRPHPHLEGQGTVSKSLI